MNEIECDNCHEKFEYEADTWIGQDGYTYEDVETMPDGYFRSGLWICDNCGSCPECGKSLEKEKHKLCSMCDDCLEAVQE